MEKSEELNKEDFVEDEDETGGSDITGDDEESETKDPESEESQEDSEKKKEEKAKNARFAELRRKQEAEAKAKAEEETRKREQKIRDEATLKAKLGVIKTNPYTEEPIHDEEDLKIYEIMKELEDEGKDPVADLGKRMAQLRRQEAEKAKKAQEEADAKEKASKEKIDAEINELRTKYPKVNTSELASDPLFQECLKGRAGRWTQVEIYEYYLEKKQEEDAKAKESKEKELLDEAGKKMSSTMSSAKGKGNGTPKKVQDMSDDEFDEYWKDKYGE